MNDAKATELARLKQLPDAETAEAAYEALLEEIATALVDRHDAPPFDHEPEVSRAGCTGPPVGGQTAQYLLGGYGAIPDSEWPQAVATVKEIAEPAGFVMEAVIVDKPGDHEIALGNPDGASLTFGTRINTALLLSGSCHLPRSSMSSTAG